MRGLVEGPIIVCEWLSRISGVLLIALSLPIAYDVTMRKLGHPTIWAFDVSLYLLVAIVYVGVADGIRGGSHFRVHLLIDKFPKARRWLDIFDLACVFLFGVILLWAGAQLAATSYTTHLRSTSLLQAPLFIPQLTLPLAGLSLALEALALAVKRVQGVEITGPENAAI